MIGIDYISPKERLSFPWLKDFLIEHIWLGIGLVLFIIYMFFIINSIGGV